MDITTAITKLKENPLRTKVVIPTLLALGMYKVEDWHGSSEQGKDLYFTYEDPFGDYKHCCCFIKSGNITKSGKTDIRKMEGQLKEAIITKFISPIDNKTEVKTEELYILCNGQISKEAKELKKEKISGGTKFQFTQVKNKEKAGQIEKQIIRKENPKFNEQNK